MLFLPQFTNMIQFMLRDKRISCALLPQPKGAGIAAPFIKCSQHLTFNRCTCTYPWATQSHGTPHPRFMSGPYLYCHKIRVWSI